MYTYGSEDCEWVHESTAEGPHSGDGEVQIVSLKGVYRKMFYLYFPDGPLINRLKMIKFGFDLAEIFNPKVWRRKNPRLAIFRLWFRGVIRTAQFLENSTIWVKSKLNSKIFWPVPRWVRIMKKEEVKISWHPLLKALCLNMLKLNIFAQFFWSRTAEDLKNDVSCVF